MVKGHKKCSRLPVAIMAINFQNSKQNKKTYLLTQFPQVGLNLLKKCQPSIVEKKIKRALWASVFPLKFES